MGRRVRLVRTAAEQELREWYSDSGRSEMMFEPLRPARGGFLRPVGTGWFVVEFLKGNSPVGSPAIDPDGGATQTGIHRAYKEALHCAWAEDMVAWEEEERQETLLQP